MESRVQWHKKYIGKCNLVSSTFAKVSFLRHCTLAKVTEIHHLADIQIIILKLLWKHVKIFSLTHGCAREAHCVTARWRNFSHYCRPLRQYDVWFTCSQHREALTAAPTSTRCTQARVYRERGKYIVRHWTSREASLRHSSGWGTWSVSPQNRDLRTRGLTEQNSSLLREINEHRLNYSNSSIIQLFIV